MGELLEFWGISFGFPFFDFQPLKAWHSLHLGTERYMTKPGGATFSCMSPQGIENIHTVLCLWLEARPPFITSHPHLAPHSAGGTV